MSDQFHERRSGDGEVRERLVRVETTLGTVFEELGRVRERVHSLANSQGLLVSASEEATDQRQAMTRKLDDLSIKLDVSVLSVATAQASMGATMAAHVEQCKTDKAEQRTQIDRLGAAREHMHAENQSKLVLLDSKLDSATKEVHARINAMLWRVIAWQGGIIAFCATAIAIWLKIPH